MQSSTLFLVQTNYANTEKQLQRLNRLLQTDDAIVMMGEAILHTQCIIEASHPIYVLDNEKALLTTDTAQIIDYKTFAELILQHTKVIRLT